MATPAPATNYPLNSKKSSPDGTAVAIRTQFEDDSPGLVKSWLTVTGSGMSEFKSQADVAAWPDLPTT